ncbi:MAG: ABC transporter ATP-binding protein [Thermomicrobiales bacterium]|nr:ABC transporter ATP-binding protein [Thermomicrobiales bacterium]
MSRVRLQEVTKRFGAAVAVDRISADIAEGEFVTLLGPSGCGKTTTLRMVAGLIDPSSGEILFDDQVVNAIPPAKRNIGLAFQSHALFPHLSVARNIAFGLEVKGRAKQETAARVREMLEMVELADYADRMPAQLSGGQQQRVALARMLATDPRVLLFDEPLSALDRNLRDTLKYSILALQRRTRKTAIYVTHDQSEAFAISDRIFVMHEGRIEQSGSQLDIYLRPQTEFVANFVGDNNALRGEVIGVERGAPGEPGQLLIQSGSIRLTAADYAGLRLGDSVLAFVRPENIAVMPVDVDAADPDTIVGRVEQIVFEGPTVQLLVDAHGIPLRVAVSGLERLRLLDAEQRQVRLRLQEVSLVRDRVGQPAAIA